MKRMAITALLAVSTIQAGSFWDKAVTAVEDKASKVADTAIDAYELIDTGIMAKMSIRGTKYWKDDELN